MKPITKWQVSFGIGLFLSLLVGVSVSVAANNGSQTVGLNPNTATVFPYRIEIIPANRSGKTVLMNVLSSYIDTNLILQSNSVTVYPEDKVITFPDPSWGMGGLIKIERAPVIYLNDGGQSEILRTWTINLGDALKENNVPPLGTSDSISPSLETPITDGMSAQITRVAVTNEIDNQTVPYQTITKNDPNLWRGQSTVSQGGVDGKLQLTYRLVRKNGVLISRTLINTTVITQEKDEIIENGTKLKIGITISGEATWYSSRYEAASHVFPRGTDLLVINKATGASVEVTVEDYMESTKSVVDLRPDLFQRVSPDLYGTMPTVIVEQILN